MKQLLYLPLIVLMSNTVMAAPPKKEAKQCKDCGCAGPEKGKCPAEAGNKCSCPKK